MDRKILVQKVITKFFDLVRASCFDESKTMILIPPAQYDVLGESLFLLAKAEEKYLSLLEEGEEEATANLAAGKWVQPSSSSFPIKMLLDRQIMTEEEQKEEKLIDAIDQFYPLIFSKHLGFGWDRIENNAPIYYARWADIAGSSLENFWQKK